MKVNISPIPTSLDKAIQEKIDNKTKPLGSLGELENIAFTIARIQQNLTPFLQNPVVLVFAGDHGISKVGIVNAFPQEVTYQMVMNFLNGGAAINVFTKSAGMEVQVVDSGVNFHFSADLPLIHAKIGLGTADYRKQPAMGQEDCKKAMQKGIEILSAIFKKGTNVVGFGDMGIGNTSSAALIMSALCDLPIRECVGKGTGSGDAFLEQKIKVLEEVVEFHALTSKDSPEVVLSTYGGFEIAQMVGGMLEAASNKQIILVDGFISTAAFLVAYKMQPNVKEYAIFTHLSEEQGHLKMLNYLGVSPLLNIGLRLGEGTGCATAYPLLKMAVAMFNEMASFESAGVSEKESND